MSVAHDLMTLQEAAAILGISPTSVSTYCGTGALKGVKQGNRWHVLASSVREYRQIQQKKNNRTAYHADGSIILLLTKGGIAYISPEDADLASLKWAFGKNGYAQRKNGIYLHRIIAERIKGTPLNIDERVDHADRNKLNCHRYNIRIATPSQNVQNRNTKGGAVSGYRGVYFLHKRRKPWHARIQVNGKLTLLGYYLTAVEAARAYNAAAIRLHDEYAVLNKIPE